MTKTDKPVVLLFMPLGGGDAYRCVPYALLYLERAVRDLDVEIILIDENTGDDFKNAVDANKGRILLAGVSAMPGYQIQGGINFSNYVRITSPEARIVWGGWQVTMLPEQALIEPYIDFVIEGQGETPFRQLVQALLHKTPLSGIAGLHYKENELPIAPPPNDFVSCTTFPPIDYTLVDLNKYILQGIPYASRTIVYFASHGCPHNCSFCALTTVYKQRWYPKPIESVIDDFRFLVSSAQCDSICFHDDNFFTRKSYSLALAKALIDSGLNLKWEVWSHAGSFMKMFSEEDLQLFYKAGLRRILFGAESGSNEVLSAINKGQTVEENLRFVRLLKKHKITPYFTTMIGFPMNPSEDINATFDMIRRARLADLSLKVHVGWFTPFPHTPFYHKTLAYGYEPPATLEAWINHTFETFQAPWVRPEHRQNFDIFLNFYVTLSNPFFFNNASRPTNEKIFLAALNWIVFPFAWLRMRFNFFKFPLGAKMFFYLLKRYNKKTGKNFMIYPH